ncbi:hypothetical protein PA10_00202 [Pseudomonas phage pPa_SNUABM_DT01]|nr:hypothetical protein PA10_00202 [Pseudomonas phage pPa_SNUABM_DT01]
MKPSLESLLADSLGEVQAIAAKTAGTGNAGDLEQPGPTESLDLITADQIQAEVTEHLKDERYNDGDILRDVENEFFLANEEEHAAMRKEIAEVREMVGAVSSSMEMLSVIASMENVDSTAVITANTAMANIASQYGEEMPPVLVAEDGAFTTASMEGMVDFVKNILVKMKKWIKEKFENMAVNSRRTNFYRGTLVKRVQALQARLDGLPEDYGIPAKPVRYDPRYLVQMYKDGQAIPFTAAALGAVCGEIISLMEKAVKDVHVDACKRSDAIGEVIAAILVTRDEIAAEEQMKKLFKDITGPWPTLGMVKPGSELMGITWGTPGEGYRSRYRDAEWIMELVEMIEINQLPVKVRRSGSYQVNMLDINAMREILDVVVNMMENPVTEDHSYYEELSGSWMEANKVWERLWTMVTTMEFNQMNNELWRAFDIATTAMFNLLDKAYYQIEDLRNPYFRMLSGSLYIMEEQAKAYVAVNR